MLIKHSDFKIGTEFTTVLGQKRWRWRCTDVGTRTIACISSEPRTIVIYENGVYRKEVNSDSSWLNGPPYAIPERVFDEYDFPACEPIT